MKKDIEKKFNIKKLHFIERTNFNFIRIKLELINEKQEFLNKVLQKIMSKNFYIWIYLYADIKTDIILKNKKSLIDRWIYNNIIFGHNYIEFFDNKYYYLNICKWNLSLTNSINKTILEKDFSIEPLLYLDSYYFDLENNFIFNLYDDRWIDILFLDEKDLNNIWKKLDYLWIKYELYLK